MSKPTRVRQELRIPIRPHVDAVLSVPFPMTEADWEQFLAVLAAMKPGLVPPEDLVEQFDDPALTGSDEVYTYKDGRTIPVVTR